MGLFSKEKNQNGLGVDSGNIDFGGSSGGYGSEPASDNTTIGVSPEVAPTQKNQTLKSVYGIEDAIQLMRTMPEQNDEMVMAIIQKTLESVNVHVKDIIDDASSKEGRIESRVEKLITEINDLSSKINEREHEINGLQTDLSETKTVRESLESVIPAQAVEEKPLAPANDELEQQRAEQSPPQAQDKSSAIPA
ncbi:MAG: hypothetical protein COB04_07945 [Gammaproteobacteria bacterium]|nr:MAG: hypothetical protein COB04_07945 [Gammaproteobacteria bacterium]